jgi:ABC-type glycerol-3-phosphate transport system substrate-binding protein
MQQLFVQKELVQVMLQPNYLSYLTENVPEDVALASYPLPGVDGKPARCLGGSSSIWTVAESSEHKEEAIELVKFLTSKTAFSEDYAKFINPGLTNFELSSSNEAMQGYIDAGNNGFIPDIYVPVNVNTEIQNTFLTDLEPNYLLGTYDLDYVTDQLNQLYEETYLSTIQ